MASSQCGLQFTTQPHFAGTLKNILSIFLGLINDGLIYSANSAKSGTFPLIIVHTKLIYSWNWWLLQARNTHTTLSWWSNNNNQVSIATNSWECRKWCFNSLVHLTIHAMAYFQSSSSPGQATCLTTFPLNWKQNLFKETKVPLLFLSGGKYTDLWTLA